MLPSLGKGIFLPQIGADSGHIASAAAVGREVLLDSNSLIGVDIQSNIGNAESALANGGAKNIGISARKDIEELLGRKVYLNLFVKTIPRWRSKEKYLLELGFKNNE